MAILTLAQAKTHLRETTSSNDADITLKLAQAEAIILDYLKTRATTIETISAANPAVVTTDRPHGLITGVTYTILGTTTTPTVNGAQVVTVLSPTTFSVPVTVTSGQGAAAGTVSTPAYTAGTAPPNVQAAILLMLSRLFAHRGDDEAADEDCWRSIENLLKRFRDPALA
ncbi:MAG TPA: head-tail connector protein [Vicinamibacterales bacterium]|nr:head-tail connector protein [Vicinamibacterales bacterium]